MTSQLTITEALVLPLRLDDAGMLASFELLFKISGVNMVPIDEVVLRKAAQLRADEPRLKTPDAVHLATAVLEVRRPS